MGASTPLGVSWGLTVNLQIPSTLPIEIEQLPCGRRNFLMATERYIHCPLQPTQTGAVTSDTNPDRYKRPPRHHVGDNVGNPPIPDRFPVRNVPTMPVEKYKYFLTGIVGGGYPFQVFV